jgi:hypothetical protein
MATKEIFVATNTYLSQLTVFWMQQTHELSQQRLSFRQCYFIMTTSMHNRNQLNIRGNKHTSNATNGFLDATSTTTIATKIKL